MLPNFRASSKTLAVFRWYVFTIWMTQLLLDPVHRLSSLPLSAYDPIGVLILFGKSAGRLFLSQSFLIGMRCVGIAALVIALASNTRPRLRIVSELVACVVLVFYQSFVRSVGAINHTETIMLFPVAALIGFDIAVQIRKLKIEDSPIICGAPIVLTMVAICCAYSFAGVHRLVVGGLVNYRSGIMTYWCVWRGLDSSFFESVGEYVTSIRILRWAMEVGFPFVTIVEALAPLCLVWPRFKWPFLVVMLVFHVGVFLMMGILFWQPVALYPVFFDLDRWVDGFTTTINRISYDRQKMPSGSLAQNDFSRTGRHQRSVNRASTINRESNDAIRP